MSAFSPAYAGEIGNLALLKKRVAETFLEHYPTLRIRELALAPTTRRDRFVYDPAECTLRLGRNALQRSKGTLVVKCGRRSHFLHYRIMASITLYKAIHQIKKDKIISLDMVEKVTQPFKRVRGRPLEESRIGQCIARQNIASGRIVTEAMVAPIPDVRKNERVRCLYKEDGIVIEFDGIALQNGYKGDNITLKKGDGRTLRGVVTGKKSVEIE